MPVSRSAYARAWRAKNSDKVRANNRRARAKRLAKNPAYEREVGLIYGKKWRARCQTEPLHWAKNKFHLIRGRCKKRGIPFNLTITDIFAAIPTNGLCPIFQCKLVFGMVKDRNNATIDRLRPWLGYVRGNIVIMSARANGIKCDCVDPGAFRRLADFLEEVL